MGVLPFVFYGCVGYSVEDDPQHTAVLWKRSLPRTTPHSLPLGGKVARRSRVG